MKEDKKTNQKQDGEISKYVKDPLMVSTLHKKGIRVLFPIQYETFNILYAGKDIVAKDSTGSGKTLAFSLPILCRFREKGLFKKPHTTKFLIVLPTRQLAIQVKDSIESLKIQGTDDFTIGAVYGGTRIEDQKEMVRRGLDIIVGTPGRLIDFLNRGVIKLNQLETLCLDEADQMLKQGFKEDIEQIFVHINEMKKQKTQNLLFSATIPDWIWSISERYQTKNRPFIDRVKDKAVRTSPTIKHYALGVAKMEKQAYVMPIINYFLSNQKGRIIIFCQTKRQVQRLTDSSLISIRKECLHGDIKQFAREKTFRKFKKGQIDCIIATNVAARGLDFPQIDIVIQMEPPRSTEDYIHRSGRTGRAGNSGICVTLFTRTDQMIVKRIEKQTKTFFHYLNQKDLQNKSYFQSQQKNKEKNNEVEEYRKKQKYSYESKKQNCDQYEY